MLKKFFSKFFQGSEKLIAQTEQDWISELTVAKLPAPAHERLKKQGTDMLDLGKLEDALVFFKAALVELPVAEAYLNVGFTNFELGRLEEAKVYVQKAAELSPTNFDAHLVLAMIAVAQDEHAPALKAVRSAIEIKPLAPDAIAILYKLLALNVEFEKIEAHAALHIKVVSSGGGMEVHLANTLMTIACEGEIQTKLFDRVVQHLHQAIKLNPASAHAVTTMGMLRSRQDNVAGAITCFKKAIAFDATFAPAHLALALAHASQGDKELATESAKNAVQADPNSADPYMLLGNLSRDKSENDVAVRYYKKVIEIKPDSPDALINLGLVYSDSNQETLALESTRQAVTLRRASPEVHFALGNLLAGQNLFSEALDCYSNALRLRPDYISARCNLGSVLLGMGNNEEALRMYQAVVVDDPSNLGALQNIAFCLSFGVGHSADEYLMSAKKFGAVVSASAKPFTSWNQQPLQNRPLKVGLVSGDLRVHPVGLFLESVLTFFDIEKTEIYAFSNRTTNDDLQLSLKSRVSHWTSIAGLTDQAAAKVIHDSGVDILLDLAGHTDMNRCALFAWRPAPVQAAWLGYWASTGIAEIDYVLSDRHSVLPEHQVQFCEHVWYTDSARLCFTPPGKTYDMVPTSCPVFKRGEITFGCFQSIKKLNQSVLTLWGRVHKRLPNARFRLQANGLTDLKIRTELLARLATAGITEDRVILLGSVPGDEYLLAHAEVDIILDSFPYPGGTTTCDALWMGVPTVTLAGNTMLSRQGVSLMTYAGLPDWVAQTEAEYVEIAVQKASDIKKLSELRAVLRQQVFQSPLFNAPCFAATLENTFRDMVLHKQPQLAQAQPISEIA